MEAKTGCVSRDRNCREAAVLIRQLAQRLADHSDHDVSDTARRILSCVSGLEE